LNDTKLQAITHAYVHWLADVHLAVFAPAFPFVVSRQEIRPQTANAHSLSRYVQVLGEKDTLRVEIEIKEVNLKKETKK